MAENLLTIHNLFLLGGGMTVIACDKPHNDQTWSHRTVNIVSSDGKKRQELVIRGSRSMLRQDANHDQIAIETEMPVQLSVEEAQSGCWLIKA
jgi:hypothetical protein